MVEDSNSHPHAISPSPTNTLSHDLDLSLVCLLLLPKPSSRHFSTEQNNPWKIKLIMPFHCSKNTNPLTHLALAPVSLLLLSTPCILLLLPGRLFPNMSFWLFPHFLQIFAHISFLARPSLITWFYLASPPLSRTGSVPCFLSLIYFSSYYYVMCFI